MQRYDVFFDLAKLTNSIQFLIVFSFLSITAGAQEFTAEKKERVVAVEQFINPAPAVPSCHASTIVELQNGDLLAAWFAGEYEGHPDVKIWMSRRAKGTTSWSQPVVVADGFIGNEHRACYNPVLFQMPDGEVLLFYKIGRFVQDWSGWLVRSRDGGLSWSTKEPLPQGFLGPVKNKPFLADGYLLCPSSTEKGGWKIHFERYDLDAYGHFPDSTQIASHATMVGPIAAEMAHKTFEPDSLSPIGCIQPSILRLADGRLQVLCRTQNGRLATSYSSDNGRSWSTVTLTSLPNNNSGTDAITLLDGRHLLVYNPTATPLGEHNAPRTPLCVAISDDAIHWHHLLTLEDSPISEYSYPAVIQGRDGTIHITYTWRRELIRYASIRIP